MIKSKARAAIAAAVIFAAGSLVHAGPLERSQAFIGGYLLRASLVCQEKMLTDAGLKVFSINQDEASAVNGAGTFNDGVKVKGKNIMCSYAHRAATVIEQQLKSRRDDDD